MSYVKRLSYAFSMNMGTKRKQPKKKCKPSSIKRYIKLLAVKPDRVQNVGLIRNAADLVIKTICNAAYNLSHGSRHLEEKEPAQEVQDTNHQCADNESFLENNK